MISFRISVQLEEPVKMKTKVKVDSDTPTAALPFESLTVANKPNVQDGNTFEIRLNTTWTDNAKRPPFLPQKGIFSRVWQKIYHSWPKPKPAPPNSYIPADDETSGRDDAFLQHKRANEESGCPQTKSAADDG